MSPARPVSPAALSGDALEILSVLATSPRKMRQADIMSVTDLAQSGVQRRLKRMVALGLLLYSAGRGYSITAIGRAALKERRPVQDDRVEFELLRRTCALLPDVIREINGVPGVGARARELRQALVRYLEAS
jgi:DNA-binding MarR family transcriptional regulator